MPWLSKNQNQSSYTKPELLHNQYKRNLTNIFTINRWNSRINLLVFTNQWGGKGKPNQRGAKVKPITSVAVKKRWRDTNLNPHTTLGFTIQFDFLVKPIPCLSLIWRVIAVLLFAANAKPNLIQTQTNCVLTSDNPVLNLASGLHQTTDVALT